jgi:NADH pyrophosphatase NudC (nudix superfamily)
MTYDPDSLDDRRALGDALIEAFTKAEFVPTPGAKGEVTYQRLVLPRTWVRVYTTIPINARAVRPIAKDAIRVCGVWEDGTGIRPSRGLVKQRRVFRVGEIEDIVERTLERAREVWRTLSKVTRCGRCGAPTFTSQKGNEVCAALCWQS